MLTTIEVKSLGVTRISIEQDQLVFSKERIQASAVEIDNQIILLAASEIKARVNDDSREAARVAFEADAGPYDFDLTRTPGEPISPEPWAEYVDLATGHRWAGWLARTGDA